ncbi:hypothetical protein L7F22_003071 [Adiantum nelumboides]|nr:hypothetical protein [Adiantum nelumboides]
MQVSLTTLLGLVVICATSFISAAVVPSHIYTERGLVPLPQNDDFYASAPGYQNAKNGDVLKSRQVVIGVLGLLPEPVEAYQVQYRTESVNRTAITSVTTIMKPVAAKTDKFVSFHTAEDSNGPQCAPSYTYRVGADQESAIVTAENLIIQTYLFQGYIVSSPDYEGPDGAFGAGKLAGTGVLDSIRAAKNFGSKVGLIAQPAIVGVGYSGGGIATGWAAGLQPTYAPDLDQNIKGWSSGGTPANLTSVVELIDGTFWAGFLPAAIAGLATPSAYGQTAIPLINELATADGQAALAFARKNCAVADLGNFAFQKVADTKFQKEGDRFLYDPRVSALVNNQTMGVNPSQRPTKPVLLYHSLNDEIIPFAPAEKLADSWCSQGSSVQFVNLANGGHITGELAGVVLGNQFVNDAFAGKVPTTGCTKRSELTSILNPLALGASLEPILFKLIDLLGKAGQNDSNIKANPSIFTNPQVSS